MTPAAAPALTTAGRFRLAALGALLAILPGVALAILFPAASIPWHTLLWGGLAALSLAALLFAGPGARLAALLGGLLVFAVAGASAGLLWRHTDAYLLQHINTGRSPYVAMDVALRSYVQQILPACLAGACCGLGLGLKLPGRAMAEAALLLLALAAWLGLHAAL